MVDREYDPRRAERLVHYIIWKAGRKPGFGATKLNKVLWYADARMFTTTGKSITGGKYVREKYGPVPHQIMPIRQRLVDQGAITVGTVRNYNREQKSFEALTQPDVSGFSEGELQTVDYWITNIAENHTAASISEDTHDEAWEMARMGEELPFSALLVSRIRDPEGEEEEWARRRAKELGLN